MFSVLPAALRALIAVRLWGTPEAPATLQPLSFQLRHVHAVTNDSRNIFSTISTQTLAHDNTYTIRTRNILAHKAQSPSDYQSARFRSMRYMENEALAWDSVELRGPNVESRDTLRQLAEMTFDTYLQPGEKGWYDVGPEWNTSYSYGWEPDADGLRGHIFVSSDESTVVVSIKGTSAPWLVGGGGKTVTKDKLNDNLLFSCCCAKVGPTWFPVCGCHQGGWKCDLPCLEKSLLDDNLFYNVGLNLYNNVTYMYPQADIWITGHSLGGALSSLIGATFGLPVVAFEAPGERMAARRLHLPSPPSLQHITHVFNTADPVPMGQCTGVTSSCASGGYALESQCHLGKIIRYDTISKLGWSSSVRNHQIDVVIDNLLSADWEVDENGKTIREVPEAVDEDPDCQDCFKWEIADFRSHESR